MNPRREQYALSGSVHGWTRLRQLDEKQRQTVLRCYRGREPRVYSRYGVRQWAGPWPGTRLVIKDPFAMLSVPALAAATGARPVLVYRHPGAVLASYRRMGWTADLEEARALPEAPAYQNSPELTENKSEGADLLAMAYFWSTLNQFALDDLDGVEQALIVSHEELAIGGEAALRTLFDCCQLEWSARVDRALRGSEPERTDGVAPSLHSRGRVPEQVAQAWRSRLTESEIAYLESVAAPALRRLEGRRLRFPGALDEQGLTP